VIQASETATEAWISKLYWLSESEFARIEPLLPRGRRGAYRVDDRRVISRIVHVLHSGARWRDCPTEYGPHTTIYNRWGSYDGNPCLDRRARATAGILLLAPGNPHDVTVAPDLLSLAGPHGSSPITPTTRTPSDGS
jgi:hypothetical protein